MAGLGRWILQAGEGLWHWLEANATGRDTCFGLRMHELVPFWLCVAAATAVVYVSSCAKEGSKGGPKKGRRVDPMSLLGVWFSKQHSGKVDGYAPILDDVSQKLEAAYAPPTSVCKVRRMVDLCTELGIQHGLKAASVAVLLALQHRRRYGAASLALREGASRRPLQVSADFEAPSLTFAELLKAVDRAIGELEPLAGAAAVQEGTEVEFQWKAEGSCAAGPSEPNSRDALHGQGFENGRWQAAAEAGGSSSSRCSRWFASLDGSGRSLHVRGTSQEEAQSFQLLFERAAEESSANVWQLPFVPKSSAETVAAWGRAATQLDSVSDPASGRLIPIPRLLASLGRAGSDAPAVAGDGFALSHRELHRRAAVVAEAVARARARCPAAAPSPAVLVYVGRGEAIAPAFLGVLQAGCHVVPADLHWPLERVRHAAEAARALLALVEPASVDRWRAVGAAMPSLTLDTALFEQGGSAPSEPKLEGLEQDDPAVVLFTSGSTGLPKGIILSHGYLTALVHGVAQSKRMSERTRTLCYHSPTWMPFLDYLFGPLLRGGCCLYFPEGKSHVVAPNDLRAFGIAHGATTAGFVPAMLDILLEEGLPPSLTGVGVGGAAVPADLCLRALEALWAASAEGVLYTGYSGTEQGDVTQLQMRAADDVELGVSEVGHMGAGRPHGAQRCKVLDRNFQLVGIEGVGEICVAGPGLASGYLQLPEKTAETFVASAPAFDGQRMARSGDLGMWTPTGSLKVVGRRDTMVKVRGARIELGEVEAAVSSHAAVKAVVVAVWQDQLVAYVVPAIPADLRDHCKARLVPYMVPHIFEGIEELPKLPNGKVNRRALPEPAIRADGVETVMELDSLGQMRKFNRRAASEDRVLDNVRAILIAVVIQSHAINLNGSSPAMFSAQSDPLGKDWGPVQLLLLKLVYSGGWSSLAFLSGFDDTRAMRPYGLTYREALFIALWPMLGFMWTLWYLPVFVYMRVAFCAAHHLGVERLHLFIAAQAWIILPAFVDFYIGWTPNGPPGPCPSQCYCPFEALPAAEPALKLIFGWWVNETDWGTGDFTRKSFVGHGMIFIPCYWIGFYTGGPIFRVLTRIADEPSAVRRCAVAAVVFAVYLVMYRLPVIDAFSDRCEDFWSAGGSFVYTQVLKNLLYYSLNLGMSLLYVFFIAACVPVHLKHLAKVSFSALVLSGFVPCINDYAVMALDLRRWVPQAIAPGVELAWIFSVPVLFVLVAGSALTAALPVVVRGVLGVVRALRCGRRARER